MEMKAIKKFEINFMRSPRRNAGSWHKVSKSYDDFFIVIVMWQVVVTLFLLLARFSRRLITWWVSLRPCFLFHMGRVKELSWRVHKTNVVVAKNWCIEIRRRWSKKRFRKSSPAFVLSSWIATRSSTRESTRITSFTAGAAHDSGEAAARHMERSEKKKKLLPTLTNDFDLIKPNFRSPDTFSILLSFTCWFFSPVDPSCIELLLVHERVREKCARHHMLFGKVVYG